MNNGTDDDKNATIPPPEKPVSPPGEPDPPMPSPDADYLALGVYVRDRFQARRDLEEQATGFGRRSAVQMWYAGAALDIINRRETKEKGWKNWCNTLGFNVGTCYEAMRLYKRSGSVENIRGMTITEARSHYKTDKGTWTPPGAEPQGGEPTAAATADTTEPTAADAATAEPTTEGTPVAATAPAEAAGDPQGGNEGNEPLSILGRLREELESLADVADDLAKPDAAIEGGDVTIAIKRIDEVMVKLREAKKALQKSAKASAKATATVNATAKVGDEG